MPLIQEAGGTVDVQRLLELVARYSDTPEISEIVSFVDKPMPSPVANQGQMPQPPSQKTTVNVGQPGTTREGAANAIQQSLLSQAEGADSRG